jgi:hypothetical protein
MILRAVESVKETHEAVDDGSFASTDVEKPS